MEIYEDSVEWVAESYNKQVKSYNIKWFPMHQANNNHRNWTAAAYRGISIIM